MSENSWAMDLESNVFSVVKYKANKVLQKKYPGIRFVSSEKPSAGKNTYPVVYLHRKSMVEKGMDLERKKINGVRLRMQVDVFSNDTEKTVRDVQAVVLDCFKDLSFDISGFPIAENGDSYYRSIAVVERNIDATDLL